MEGSGILEYRALGSIKGALGARRWSLNMLLVNLGSILVILGFLMTAVTSSHLPKKYPIEVYQMLQARSQFGFGRDNRVRGTWSAWSAWSECSRTCGTGIQSQARECVPLRVSEHRRRRRRMSPVTGNSSRPVCIGTYKRYHTCNTWECPNQVEDLRAEQCAKYNERSYKGHNYVWVPFLDAPNLCALNCRAVGQRFYATLESSVIDGTPCDGTNHQHTHNTEISMEPRTANRWLCVSGQCKPVGCDGVVGSGAMVDACGVCGGRGDGCRLYEGIFMEPILPKGHQPMTTIPKGAMSLNISELRYSGNFLALRDNNGSYILNGPRSYSPSGTYKAAGATITYHRGNRIRPESIVTNGPLNESLHLEIIWQEMNPGVMYKYMLPLGLANSNNNAPKLISTSYGSGLNAPDNEIPNSDNPVTVPASGPRERETASTLGLTTTALDEGRGEEMRQAPTTSTATERLNRQRNRKRKKRRRKFTWVVSGLTPCSKECGGGTQTALFKCLRESNRTVVNERRCKNIEKPQSPPPLRCNDRPCPARWMPEGWGPCSVSCGVGVRSRKLVCVQELNSRMTMRVPAGACIQPPNYKTVEPCNETDCVYANPELKRIDSQLDTPRWSVGSWGPCSATCGKGIHTRRVTCITSGESCPIDIKPVSERPCEISCQSSTTLKPSTWLYSDWPSTCSTKCGTGIETRLVACSDENESFCDVRKKPESERQCRRNDASCDKPEWFIGPWNSCSVPCGNGIQSRKVLCILKTENTITLQNHENCDNIKPAESQPCNMNACPALWLVSDWSKCSTTCGSGTQTRIVRCVNEGIASTDCNPSDEPTDERVCNLEPCKKELVHEIKSFKNETAECVDKYPNCSLVVKNGLCRIRYYKHSCCQCREK